MHLPYSSFAFIYYFARQQWPKFLLLIFTSVVWALNDTIFPYLLKKIVNTLSTYQGPRDEIFSVIGGTAILIACFWLFAETCMRLQGITTIYTFPRFRADIRAATLNYVKSHSHTYFSNHLAGDIAQKIADLPQSCQMVMEIICFNFIVAVVGACIALTTMWLTQPIFAIILFSWLCLHLGLTSLFLVFGNRLWTIHSDSFSTLSGKIIDMLTNMLNVRLFARNRYEESYLKRYQTIEINKAKKAMWGTELIRVALGLSGLLLIFSMLFTLIYGWVHHWVNLGDFTQIGMQTFWLLAWLWFVSFQITVFARELGTINNALTLIKATHDITDKENAQNIAITKGEIHFENVSFAYQKNRPVFKNLNLVIPSGQKVGLVGFSGAGKTTLVNLILRFFDINQGNISIDGQNITEVSQDSLRSQISMIPQDPSLFHRSLMENIRYGRINATDQEVIEASKLAHCHEFIEKLDEGYHTLVGERGIKLSGGQRQRIAIARAFLKNAPILILDEATSSLDSVTERLIQESLHQLMQKCTTIVVAHRLSTLSNMDRILVFDKGTIVEDDTQNNLLRASGRFASLWQMQINGFLPDEDNTQE